METHHNNNGLSSLEGKAGSSSNDGSNNSLDDAVGKLLQGMHLIIDSCKSIFLKFTTMSIMIVS